MVQGCYNALVQVFIADIRNCQSKEQEKARVDKELGKIRKKFASGNAITGIQAGEGMAFFRVSQTLD